MNAWVKAKWRVEREAKYLESYMEWREDNVEQVPSNDPVQLQAKLDGPGAQLKKRRRQFCIQ